MNERLFEKIQAIELKRLKSEKQDAKHNTLSKDEKRKAEQQKKRDELMNIGRNAGKKKVN